MLLPCGSGFYVVVGGCVALQNGMADVTVRDDKLGGATFGGIPIACKIIVSPIVSCEVIPGLVGCGVGEVKEQRFGISLEGEVIQVEKLGACCAGDFDIDSMIPRSYGFGQVGCYRGKAAGNRQGFGGNEIGRSCAIKVEAQLRPAVKSPGLYGTIALNP